MKCPNTKILDFQKWGGLYYKGKKNHRLEIVNILKQYS